MEKKVHQFGRTEEYLLDERALRHILDGDFVVRPITDINGKKTTEEVLSGGLHTFSGWNSFLAKHSGVVHSLDYDPEVNDEWYFARELQNGVIALKIPRRLFSKDAAAITMMPDIHYKSGYRFEASQSQSSCWIVSSVISQSIGW